MAGLVPDSEAWPRESTVAADRFSKEGVMRCQGHSSLKLPDALLSLSIATTQGAKGYEEMTFFFKETEMELKSGRPSSLLCSLSLSNFGSCPKAWIFALLSVLKYSKGTLKGMYQAE